MNMSKNTYNAISPYNKASNARKNTTTFFNPVNIKELQAWANKGLNVDKTKLMIIKYTAKA